MKAYFDNLNAWEAQNAADREASSETSCENCTRFAGSLSITCSDCGREHPFTRTEQREISAVRERLLADVASKPIRRFRQYDVFPRVGFDMNPPYNDQGDQHYSGIVDELRRGTPVRVQVSPDVKPADAVRALRDIAHQIEQYGFAVDTAPALPF